MLKLVSTGICFFLLSFSLAKGTKIQTNDCVEFKVVQDCEIKEGERPDFLDSFFVFESLLKNSKTLAKMVKDSSEPLLFLDINAKVLEIINCLNYLLEHFSIPTAFENINNKFCMDEDIFNDYINAITYLALSKKFDNDLAYEFSLKLYPFLYSHKVNPQFFSIIQALRLAEKNNIDFNEGNEQYDSSNHNYTIKSFKNGLCWAACYGHIEATKFFLDAGVLIDYHNPRDMTSFDYAALNSQLAIIKLLIERGVSSDLVTRGLCLAIGEASLEMCDLLLDSGITVNDNTFVPFTPLHRVCIMSNDPYIIKKLLAMGARIDCKSRDGNTSLHVMCMHLCRDCKLQEIKNSDINNLLLLISESIFDPNQKIKHISSLQDLILRKVGNDAELLLDALNRSEKLGPKIIRNIVLYTIDAFPFATLKELFKFVKDQSLSDFIKREIIDSQRFDCIELSDDFGDIELSNDFDDKLIVNLQEIILRKIAYDSTLLLNTLNEFENTQMYRLLIDWIVNNRNLSDIGNLVLEGYKVLSNNKHQAELVSALCNRHLKYLQSTISIKNYNGKTVSDILKGKNKGEVNNNVPLALFDQISKAETLEDLGELAKKIRTMYEWRLNPERALTVFQIS